MKDKKPCDCPDDFETVIAVKRLQQKYTALADVVAAHFSSLEEDKFLRDNLVKITRSEKLYKIVGGRPVAEGQFAECCLIGHKDAENSFEWFCSGVLVRPNLVVTAAHCFLPGEILYVALNATDQSNLQGSEIIASKQVAQHPDYRESNDVCAIVLANSTSIIPVPLATTQEILASQSVTLVGFGRDDIYSTRGFGIKREVTVNFISVRKNVVDDMTVEEKRFGFMSNLEFVAGGHGYDSCNGDSGGPAYVMVNGTRKVAGLTSRATRTATNPCGDGGIYSRVDAFSDFFNRF